MTIQKLIASAAALALMVGVAGYTLSSLAGGIEEQQQHNRQLVAGLKR